MSTEPFCCSEFKSARKDWKIYLVNYNYSSPYYEVRDSEMYTILDDISYCAFCGKKLEPKPGYMNSLD